MYAQVEKSKEHKSRAVANFVAQQKSSVKQAFGIHNNGYQQTGEVHHEKPTPHYLQEKTITGPIQMTTIHEHFQSGKKVVAAGEVHSEIPEEKEKEYWRGNKKRLIYENDFLDVDMGGDDDERIPIDNLYACVLSALKIITNTLQAILNAKDIKKEAAEFNSDGGKYAPATGLVSGLLSDIEKMEEVELNESIDLFTSKQQTSARLIGLSITNILEVMTEIEQGTKDQGDLQPIVDFLTKEENRGKTYLGVESGETLTKFRSKWMVKTLESFASKASSKTVYKVGENHVTDMTGLHQTDGDGWAAISRDQYLKDTGLQKK